jgi:tape measure domain-containing protein
MTDLIVRVRADTSSVDAGLLKVESRLAQVAAESKQALPPVAEGVAKVASATRSAERNTAAWAGAFAGFTAAGVAVNQISGTIGAVARELLTAQINAERLSIGLQFSAGANAGRDLEFLREVTSRLGLEFGSTATAYQKFAAASRETRLEGAGARAVFESVAKASAVMGLSAQDTSGVLLALQQMISKGTVQAEELRGQLGERLPGAFQIAARAMGVTTAELGKMLEQGQVIADEFLPKFAAQLDKELGSAAEKAANRTEAAVNRLKSAWDRLLQNNAQAGSGSFIGEQLNVLRDGLDSVSEAYEKARKEGAGWWGQQAAGAAAIASFLNPLNAFVYRAQSAGERLIEARQELMALQEALQRQPNNLLLKNALRDTQALVRELERARAAGGVAMSAFGTQGSADNQGAREAARQRSRIEADALAVMQQASGVNKDFLPNLNKLHAAYDAGILSIERYREEVAALIEKQGGGADVAAKFRREQEAAAKAFDDAINDSWKIIWADAERQAVAARKALEEENKARTAYGAELAKGIDKLDEEIARRRQALVEMGLTTEGLTALRQAQFDAAIAAEERKLAAVELDDAERRAIELRIQRLQELRRLEGEGGGMAAAIERERAGPDPRQGTRAEDGWRQAFDRYVAFATDAAGQTEQVFALAAVGMEDAIVRATQTGKLSFESMLNDMIESLVRSGFRQMMAEILGSEGFQDLGWGIFQAFGGGMATGGRPQMGRPYLVGERGPELFVPDQSGAVVPNHQLGAAGTSVSVNVINNTPAQVSVRERQEPGGGVSLDVVVDAMEARLADNVATGRGSLATALQGRFGLAPRSR